MGTLGDVEILLGLEVTVTNETGSNLGGISISPDGYEIEGRDVLKLAPDVEKETNFLLSLSNQLRQLSSTELDSPAEVDLVSMITRTAEQVLNVSPSVQLAEVQDSGSAECQNTVFRFCSTRVLGVEDPDYEYGSVYTYTITVADPETSSNYTISVDEHENLTLEVEDSVDNQKLGDAPLCSVRTLTEPFDMDELRPFMNAIENLLVAVELGET